MYPHTQAYMICATKLSVDRMRSLNRFSFPGTLFIAAAHLSVKPSLLVVVQYRSSHQSIARLGFKEAPQATRARIRTTRAAGSNRRDADSRRSRLPLGLWACSMAGGRNRPLFLHEWHNLSHQEMTQDAAWLITAAHHEP